MPTLFVFRTSIIPSIISRKLVLLFSYNDKHGKLIHIYIHVDRKNMFILTVVLTCIFGVIIWKLILFSINHYYNTWLVFKNIQGPKNRAYPFIGHGLTLPGNVIEGYKITINRLREHAEYSATNGMGVRLIGPAPFLYVYGPHCIKTLLHSSHHSEKSFFYEMLHPWLNTGLLTSSGEKWKLRRKLLTPAFHFSILNDFLVVMNEQAGLLAKNMEKFCENVGPFDVCIPVALCTLDIICETAMGRSIRAQNNEHLEYVQSINRVGEIIFERARRPILWPDFIFNLTKQGRDQKKYLNLLKDFNKSVIDDRMKTFKKSQTTPKRLALLDMLLELADDGKFITSEGIEEEVHTFMFAGHDTTAAAIYWTLYLIGLHHDVQKKVQTELNNVFSNSPSTNVTMNDLKKLKYLEMVCKESARIYPPVPVISRITTVDCEMDGHRIPARTTCTILMEGINKNPNHWKDPDKFDPERFTSENSAGRHPYAYIPFSAGPRNCIGQKFAVMEEKVVLSHFLRKYHVESCDKPEDLKLLTGLILRPVNGINIKITRRAKH